MNYIAATSAIASNAIATCHITADCLTEGDIIKHFTGDTWQVISEPEYTTSGIVFDVLWIDVDSLDNTQSVSFAPNWRFELIGHSQSSQVAA